MNRKPAPPAPRKPRKPTVKVSDALVAECLRAKFGNVTETAKALGVDCSGLRRRVRDTPHLAQVLDEARESIVDLAETMLAVAVRKGEDWAVKRVLESKHAVARGWRPPAQYEIAAAAVALTPEERERRIREVLGIPAVDAPPEPPPPAIEAPPAP